MTTLVFDIECYPNFFCLNTLDIDTGVKDSYVLHEDIRDDRIGLVKFLNDGIAGKYVLIGFNSINYDTQVLTYIHSIKHTFLARSLSKALAATYRFSSKVIKSDRSPYPEWKIPFVQYDLFKIHHYDNKARTTSLKRLEFYLRWPDLRDLPYSPLHPVTREQGLDLSRYCDNDVAATFEFWKKTVADGKIELRRQLASEHGLEIQNANDVKIGGELFAKYLSEDMEIDVYELKKMRTYHKRIRLGECIPDVVSFTTPQFQKMLGYLKKQTVTSTKGVFKDLTVRYKGVPFVYGTGGLHAANKAGIYEENELYEIIDLDFASYYPNIAINFDYKPEHLGDSFSRIYKWMYEERAKIPKSNPNNGALKLALNGSFGKGGDVNSFFFSLKFIASITLTGQMLLTMLIEQVVETVKDVQIIQANTDGFTIRSARVDRAKIEQICTDFEKLTNLKLEYVNYSKVIMRDVDIFAS